MTVGVMWGFGNNGLKFAGLHSREPWAGSQESPLCHSSSMWLQTHTLTSLGLHWDCLWFLGAGSFPDFQMYSGFPSMITNSLPKLFLGCAEPSSSSSLGSLPPVLLCEFWVLHSSSFSFLKSPTICLSAWQPHWNSLSMLLWLQK